MQWPHNTRNTPTPTRHPAAVHRAAAKDHRPGKQQSNQSRFHFVLSPLADETANQRIEGTALSAPPLLYFFWRHSLSRAQKVC